MDYTVIIFIFTLGIGQGFAYTLGDCEIGDNGEIDWTVKLVQIDPVKDVEALSKSYAYTGPLVVDTPLDGDTGKKYIDVTNENNQIAIKTNEEFNTSFEKDQRATAPGSPISISRTIRFTCGELSEQIIIVLPVEDTNNNKPAFKASTYKYIMAMPLVPRIDLTSLGDPIVVEDLDFSNTDVTFTVSNDKFTVEMTPGEDPRLYRPILRVSEYTTLTEDTTLTITATDNGNPTSSGTADITITIDTDLSLPSIPTFTDALYRFAYSEDGGTPTITPSDSKEIVVKTDDPSKTAVTLNTDGTKYFTATFDKDTSKVTLESSGTPVDKTSEPALVLELTVTFNDQSSKTVILIDLPIEDVASVPQFSAPFYRAKYSTASDPHTITIIDEVISVTSNAVVIVDDPDHFGTTKSDEKWVLVVLKNLDDDVLKAGEDIILTLDATVVTGTNSLVSHATVIVNLPEIEQIEVPKFTKVYYSGTCEVDASGHPVVTLSEPIAVTSPDQTVEFSFTETSEIFSIKSDTGDITVIGDVPESKLKSRGQYILALQASIPDHPYISSGFATVIITMPASDPSPEFAKIYYKAEYQVKGEDGTLDTLEIREGSIELTNPNATVNVKIEDGTNSDQFSIAFNPENNNYQVLTLTVSTDDPTETDEVDDNQAPAVHMPENVERIA